MKHSFFLLSTIFAIIIAAAAAPSPLYAVFQQQWHFSEIMLTVIFSVYAFSLLLALLFIGSLSDYIGRKPVLMSALLLEAISMSIFALAKDVNWLIIARILQGIATGTATSVLSAALIDTQPKDKPGLAPLINTIVPVGSLGVGAIISGLLVEYVIWPTHLIFWLICSAAIITGICVLFLPETVRSKPGWLRSLLPIISLPKEAKAPLIKVGASLIACWALVGLYLSLGPSVAIDLLHKHNYVIGGLIVLALTAAGALSSFALKSLNNNRLTTIGAIASIIGLSLTAYSVTITNPLLFFIGTIVAGIGFGPAFTGSFRSIMSQAPGDKRAGLASIVYIISYLAFSIPIIIAGIAITKVGLYMTVFIYSISALLLYLATLILLRLQTDK